MKHCLSCLIYYVKRSCSRSFHGAVHDPGPASNSESSDSTNHIIHPREAQILEHGVTNYQKKLFMEAFLEASFKFEQLCRQWKETA